MHWFREFWAPWGQASSFPLAWFSGVAKIIGPMFHPGVDDEELNRQAKEGFHDLGHSLLPYVTGEKPPTPYGTLLNDPKAQAAGLKNDRMLMHDIGESLQEAFDPTRKPVPGQDRSVWLANRWADLLKRYPDKNWEYIGETSPGIGTFRSRNERLNTEVEVPIPKLPPKQGASASKIPVIAPAGGKLGSLLADRPDIGSAGVELGGLLGLNVLAPYGGAPASALQRLHLGLIPGSRFPIMGPDEYATFGPFLGAHVAAGATVGRVPVLGRVAKTATHPIAGPMAIETGKALKDVGKRRTGFEPPKPLAPPRPVFGKPGTKQ